MQRVAIFAKLVFDEALESKKTNLLIEKETENLRKSSNSQAALIMNLISGVLKDNL